MDERVEKRVPLNPKTFINNKGNERGNSNCVEKKRVFAMSNPNTPRSAVEADDPARKQSDEQKALRAQLVEELRDSQRKTKDAVNSLNKSWAILNKHLENLENHIPFICGLLDLRADEDEEANKEEEGVLIKSHRLITKDDDDEDEEANKEEESGLIKSQIQMSDSNPGDDDVKEARELGKGEKKRRLE